MSNKIYLNTASCGLLSRESLQATYNLYDGMTTNSSETVEPLRDHGLQRIRETMASFMYAPASNIAFLPNFSFGINALVQSLRGDEKVLLYNNDYPSVTAAFKVNNFNITWVGAADDGFTIRMDELKDLALKNQVDMLVISHVQWLSAFKIDLEDLGNFCKEHDIIFIVDATQSLGAVPIYISKLHVDVLISSHYKWMNAGFGSGIMYMSDSFLERYKPVIAGSNSYVVENGDLSYVPSIKCYEPGHLNLHGLLILESATNHKLSLGMEHIGSHNQRLVQKICDGVDPKLILGPATMDNRSSIIMINDPGGIYERITDRGFVTIKRSNNIRVSPHFYNTEEEVEAFIACVNKG